jgi:serine/threonine protein kinase
LATDLGGDLLRTALLGAASPVLDARYHIRKVLGRGVTGVVLSAYDERLKREVAIKVAPSSAASARMLEEARALARMQRPMFVVAGLGGGERLLLRLSVHWARELHRDGAGGRAHAARVAQHS